MQEYPAILYGGVRNIFNMGSPVATDAALDHEIANAFDMRLYKTWKAASAGTKYISVDAGSAIAADALGIAGHNLKTADADVSLEYSLGGMDSFVHQNPDASYVGNFRAIAYGNGKFVAIGFSGEIQTSTFGIDWTHQYQDDSYTGAFYGITFGNGQFVICGQTGEIQTSPDGITWTHQDADASYTGTFNAVTYGENSFSGIKTFIVVGNLGEIQTSPDGITWTHQSAGGGFSNAFYGATFGNNVFIIVGYNAEIQVSGTNGLSWVPRTAAGGYGSDFYGAAYNNNTFVIVGRTGEIQTSTSDGTVWTHQNADASYTGWFYGATFGEDLFVICGQTGEIQTSPDGITWSAVTPAASYTGTFYGAAYGNAVNIVVGATAEIQTAPVNWVEILAAFTPDDDTALVKLFTETIARYWRLKIVTASIAPYIADLTLASLFRFPRYLNGEYNPRPDKVMGFQNFNDSGGQLLGSNLKAKGYENAQRFVNIWPSWVNDNYYPAWYEHFSLLKPFYWTWDTGNHPEDVFFVVMPSGQILNSPYRMSRRTISFNLIGVGEE